MPLLYDIRLSTPAAPVTPPPDPPPPGVGFFVATNGSASNPGTLASPWTLTHALSGAGGIIVPGDTVWLRGGTYSGAFTSSLTGTAANPIIVRQYPTERATIAGSIQINGAYTWFWGFEVMQPAPAIGQPSGVNIFGNFIKAINLVVHDAGSMGIGFWSNGAGGELYGNILYNNGRQFNLDHGIYTENAIGTKRIADNVIFNSLASNINCFASAGSIVGFDIQGNTCFSGAIHSSGTSGYDILVGGGTPASAISLRDNMTRHNTNGTNANIGFNVAQNVDIVLTGNYFITAGADGTPVMRFSNWSQATVTGNTFYGVNEMVLTVGNTSNITWGSNVHHRDPTAALWGHNGTAMTLAAWKSATGFGATDTSGSAIPTGTRTFVRPNTYEASRGFVTIYNWGLASTVAVDVSSVLAVGATYAVRNIENVFGSPIMSGTYIGGTLSFPMSAVASPVPLGSGMLTPPPTGPAFQVFLITST